MLIVFLYTTVNTVDTSYCTTRNRMQITVSNDIIHQLPVLKVAGSSPVVHGVRKKGGCFQKCFESLLTRKKSELLFHC